jgi:hypothetical protein
MNPRRCSTPLFAWRQAIVDGEVGPQTCRVAGATVSRRIQVTVAVTGLSLHMNQRGSKCWPSVGRVAGECALHERTVQRANLALVEQGFLAVVRGGGRGRTNRYVIQIPGRVSAAIIAASPDASELPEWLVSAAPVKGGTVPPFNPETPAPCHERVAPSTENPGTVPPEVLKRSQVGPQLPGFEAAVIDLAAARARRASPAPYVQVEGRAAAVPALQSVTTAEPPAWTWVWWFARARGETRTFPQLATGGEPPGDVLSEAEYRRLEAQWRAAGSPVGFDPRMLTNAEINFALKEIDPA